MINFTGGIIKTPSCYINPNNIINFCDNDGAVSIAYTDRTIGELEGVTSRDLANAIIKAEKTGQLVDVLG